MLYTVLKEMKEIIDKIIDIIKPVFEREHVHLVDIDLRGGGRSQVLSIYADTESGITLEQITQLNREISDQLDMHDVIPGAYRLDVSSPGVDRPLKFLWQYRKNINRFVQVNYLHNGKPKEITAKLKNVEESEIVLTSQKGDIMIPFSSIKKAKVKVMV